VKKKKTRNTKKWLDPNFDRKTMKLIFAGTPEFASTAMQALVDAGHEIVLVLTQPDRPAGRGMKLQASAVKQFALENNIPVAQPRSLRLDGKFPEEAEQGKAAIDKAIADGAQAMIVAAYGLILPQWALTSPKLGCLNIHASLLPRWRGAAPIHRAIEAGDATTGVTIMQMDVGLDTGDMLLRDELPILDIDTTGSLHDKLGDMGGDLIVKTLAELANLKAEKQPEEGIDSGITYAHKIEKTEAHIDWSQSAEVITRRIRAFNPFPGAATTLNGEQIKVWGAELGDKTLLQADKTYKNGQIVALAGVFIACAAINNVVNLTELQRPGGKRLKVADFVRGFDVQVGMCFGEQL
jgi:methionyl-tRNA formyltransferase